MSMAVLMFPTLSWAEVEQILQFLSTREIMEGIGQCNKSAFVTCRRERVLREASSQCRFKKSRFLSKYSPHDKVVLVSYPRCGNSYMRRVLEERTSIVTGSDNRPNRPLAASLLKFGYRGEAITDNSVWVVKSHYPERMGYIRVPAKRSIVVVRNPFDAMESYFHMAMTCSHEKKLTSEAFRGLQSTWSEFLRNEAQVWVSFYDYWMQVAVGTGLPVLFVRYEDMLAAEQENIDRVLSFMCEGRAPTCYLAPKRSSLSSSNKPLVSVSPPVAAAALPGYMASSAARGIGASLKIVCYEDLEFAKSILDPMLLIFGYELVLSTSRGINRDNFISDHRSSGDRSRLGAINGGAGRSSLTMENNDSSKVVLHPFESSVAVQMYRAGFSDSTRGSGSSSSSSSVTPQNNKGASQITVRSRSGGSCNQQEQQQHSIESQNFPNPSNDFVVNASFNLRSSTDKFGRDINEVRRALTQNDTVPFPTVIT